jgi:hypothetical protein
MRPGDVLVTDAKGYLEAGPWGDVLTAAAQAARLGSGWRWSGAGSRLATRLGMGVSRTTLLRMIRALPDTPVGPVTQGWRAA